MATIQNNTGRVVKIRAQIQCNGGPAAYAHVVVNKYGSTPVTFPPVKMCDRWWYTEQIMGLAIDGTTIDLYLDTPGTRATYVWFDVI